MTDLIEAMASALQGRIYGDERLRRDLPGSPYNKMIQCARAALAALDAKGYAVVPKVPTAEMIEAALRDDIYIRSITAIGAYKAMLAAAPKVTP